jgi:hypothetical protein
MTSTNLRVFHDNHEHDPELWAAIHRLEAILDEHEEMGLSFKEVAQSIGKAAVAAKNAVKNATDSVIDAYNGPEATFKAKHGDKFSTPVDGLTYIELSQQRDAVNSAFADLKSKEITQFAPIQSKYDNDTSKLKSDFAPIKSAYDTSMANVTGQFTTDKGAFEKRLKAMAEDHAKNLAKLQEKINHLVKVLSAVDSKA